MMRQCAILLTALLFACQPAEPVRSDVSEPAVQEKTGVELRKAYALSNEIIPLIYPHFTSDGISLPASERARLIALLENHTDNHIMRCLMKQGFGDYMVDEMLAHEGGKAVRQRLATYWANIYPVELLTKVSTFVQSPASHKFVAYQKQNDKIKSESVEDVIAKMYAEGRLTDADASYLRAGIKDEEVAGFLSSQNLSYKASIDEVMTKMGTTNMGTYTERFMSKKNTGMIYCEKNAS